MKIVVQRVSQASVSVNGRFISQIKQGFLCLVGLHVDDKPEKFVYLINKILNLRVFSDEAGKMNKSILDNSYEVLLVSQFTLYGDCKKGNRPSFTKAMSPDKAKSLYQQFVKVFQNAYDVALVKDGEFGAYMQVSLSNDGPVTIILEH